MYAILRPYCVSEQSLSLLCSHVLNCTVLWNIVNSMYSRRYCKHSHFCICQSIKGNSAGFWMVLLMDIILMLSFQFFCRLDLAVLAVENGVSLVIRSAAVSFLIFSAVVTDVQDDRLSKLSWIGIEILLCALSFPPFVFPMQ